MDMLYGKNDMSQLFTIGHSNQSQEEFLAMLCRHGVNCVVDVRSVPASKYTPQFNTEELRRFLKHNDVQYLHFGNEFGARLERGGLTVSMRTGRWTLKKP